MESRVEARDLRQVRHAPTAALRSARHCAADAAARAGSATPVPSGCRRRRAPVSENRVPPCTTRWPAPSHSLRMRGDRPAASISSLTHRCGVASASALPQSSARPPASATASLASPWPMPESCPLRSSRGSRRRMKAANFRLDEPALMTRMRLVISAVVMSDDGDHPCRIYIVMVVLGHDHPRVCLRAETICLSETRGWSVPSPTMTDQRDSPCLRRR